MEIWKDIIFDNNSEIRYEVSSLGRVRSKSRKIHYNKGCREFVGKTLILNLKENYYRVAIKYTQNDKNAKTNLVHRLVAKAFIPNPFNHPLVDHIDNNTLNNNVNNLRWVSHQENALNRKKYGSEDSRKKVTINCNYEEIWVDASNFDTQFSDLGDSFQISNHGRFRYKSKIRNFKNYSYTTPAIDKWCNYPIITFNIKGYKKYKRRVHNIIAKLFVFNPNPTEFTCVNHKNGNPLDYSVTNLEWISYSENNKHAHKVGKKPNMRGELNGNSEYNEDIIKSAYELFNTGLSVRKIAKQLSVPRGFLNGVFKGKTWTHLNLPNLSNQLSERVKTQTSGHLITVLQDTFSLIINDLTNKVLKKDIAIKYGISIQTLRNVLNNPNKYVK
jgi:hypothetical protein